MLTEVFYYKLFKINDINYIYIRKHINIMCTIIYYHISMTYVTRIHINFILIKSLKKNKTYLYLLIIVPIVNKIKIICFVTKETLY